VGQLYPVPTRGVSLLEENGVTNSRRRGMDVGYPNNITSGKLIKEVLSDVELLHLKDDRKNSYKYICSSKMSSVLQISPS
jgi:hypothetical protein